MSAARDPSGPRDIAAKAETMLALAKVTGIVDLDAVNEARRRLGAHNRAYATAADGLARNEAERLVALDIAELAVAYKLLAAAVERGGEA